jgi:tubulin polyglutamylase TTLL9
MIEEGYTFKKDEDLFAGCYDSIIKTLICAEPSIVKELNKVGPRQKCCFEMYGFDIMFDKNMKPWVLEVNCLASLSSSSVFDK